MGEGEDHRDNDTRVKRLLGSAQTSAAACGKELVREQLSSAEPGGQSWDDHSHLRDISPSPYWGWARPLNSTATRGGRCCTKGGCREDPKDWTWGEPKGMSKELPPAPRKCRGRSYGGPSEELPEVKREEEQLWPLQIPCPFPSTPSQGLALRTGMHLWRERGSITLLVKLCSPLPCYRFHKNKLW